MGILGLPGIQGLPGVLGIRGGPGTIGPQGLAGSDANVPAWANQFSQVNVQLHSFGGQVNWTTQVSNKPKFTWNTVTGKPFYLKDAQLNVTLSNFGGNIDATRVNNIPTVVGPQGPAGPTGATGATCAQGSAGPAGAS